MGVPRVSVILPCYNGTRWISQAIESILAQTYKHFELLVIDDGSTDNSKEIVSSYLCDERVRYICQENRGFSGAINRGIKESKGDFIRFIGSLAWWQGVEFLVYAIFRLSKKIPNLRLIIIGDKASRKAGNEQHNSWKSVHICKR